MPRSILIVPAIALALGYLTLGTGCASSRDGNPQAKATVTSAKDSRQELVEAKGEISKAIADLDQISSHGDLKVAYRAFSTDIDAVKSREKRVKHEREQMETNQQAYITQWQQDGSKLTNDDLRRSSIDRQAAVKQHFTEVTASYRELEDDYRPLITTLGELQAALANDLTPAAVDAIKPVADTVTSDGAKVQSRINDVIGKLDSLITSLSSGEITK